MILLWLHQHITVTSKCGLSDTRYTHCCCHFQTCVSIFFSSVKLKVAGVCLVLYLSLVEVRVHAPYPAAASRAVTVTCVLRPRRSVSRSQQWKQSLSSTLSGPSRSQKKSRASWTPSTLRRQRRGGYPALFSSFFVGVVSRDNFFLKLRFYYYCLHLSSPWRTYT